jgi:amino acid transporter
MLGETIRDTVPAEFNHGILPELGWDIVLLAIACATVFLGVSLSTRMQLTLALLSITVVSIFFISVIIKVGSDNDVAQTFNPSNAPNGLSGMMYGVLYGVLLFTGFETAANLGEETHHPARDIPRAVLYSVLGITGFYLLGSYAQIAGFGFDLDAISQAASAPLFALASPGSAGGYGSVAVVRLMELVVILDMLAVMIGCATAGARGLFALGRDRRLPAALGRPSSRGVPVVAGTTLMVIYAIAILVTTQWDSLWAIEGLPHYVAMFSVLSAFGSLAMACIYFLLCVGAIRGLADHPKRWAVYLAAVVGMLVTGAAIFGAIYKVTAPVSYTPYAAVVIFLIGLAVVGSTTSAQTPVEPGEAPANT